MPSFKEWVREKTEAAKNDERKQKRDDWLRTYNQITSQINDWLIEDGVSISSEVVERAEQGLGVYKVRSFRITVGETDVEVVPMGRNTIGRIPISGDLEMRASGRIDITNGSQKYVLYRIIKDGVDVWYVMDERGGFTPWSRERLQEIIMDLMS